MSNYSFYTPTDLAKILIDLVLPGSNIASVIDICCGSWNLLNAAREKFPHARFVGVDVDNSSAAHKFDNAEFVCCDGRSFAEEQAQSGQHYDLILSNPPFGSLKADAKKYAITGNVFAESKRYEAEMFWANYRLMSDDSTLVIILPSTYVDGSSYANYRKWLAQNCCVQKVIHLPQNTFAKAKLNTVALILQKKNHLRDSSETTFYRATYDSVWEITQEGIVAKKEIESGNWMLPCPKSNKEPPKPASITILRGSISSKFFCTQGQEVLHCSSLFFRNGWQPGIRYCQNITSSQKKYAKRGDIVINRIGRSSGYWCIYRGKKRLISDCLIVIASPSPQVVAQIKAISFGNRLSVPLRGVSTQYITMEDILTMLNHSAQ